MRNKKNAGKSGSDFSPLDDDQVLELAEEVLGSSDDEIIILDDESESSKDASEDIIDLTDINDIPLSDDEDILDLTDELEEASEEDADIMELQDIADQPADDDDEIMELEDAIDAFTDSDTDEDIMNLEEVVDASGDTEEGIIDLEADDVYSGADLEDTPDTKEFSIETDTIELSEADRKALEEEFGLEPQGDLQGALGEITGAESSENPETNDTEPEETNLEDTLELAGLPGTDEETAAETVASEEEEILELTDEDRTSLEQALSADSPQDSEVLTEADSVSDVEFSAGEDMPDFPDIEAWDTDDSALVAEEQTAEAFSGFSESGTDITEDAPAVALDDSEVDAPDLLQSEDEIQFDPQDSALGDTVDLGGLAKSEDSEIIVESDKDVGQTLEAELNLDLEDEPATEAAAPQAPEPETYEAQDEIRLAFPDESESAVADADEAEQATEPVFELDAEAAAAPDETIETEPMTEISSEPILEVDSAEPQPQDSQALAGDLGLDLEDQNPPLTLESSEDEEEGGRETGTPAAQSLYDEELKDESLAEKEEDFIESLGMTIETEMAAPETAGETAEMQKAAQDPSLAVDFEQPEDSGAADLHKTADPISIRVKEHAEDNHSNEDELLSKVFQPESEAVAMPENLEQTVERLVNKMFSEKIEVILVNAIERAVTKEIDRLKSVLLGELNRMD